MRKRLLSFLLTGILVFSQQVPFQAFAQEKPVQPVQPAAITEVAKPAAVYTSKKAEIKSSINSWNQEEKKMYVKLLNNLHRNINREFPDLETRLSENVKWSDDLEYVSRVKLDYQYQYYFLQGKGFNAHVYHQQEDHDRLVKKMNGIFLDPGEYQLKGIAGPPYFYLENESYSAGTDPVINTALNIYDIVSRYLSEIYNPDKNTGHAQALLGAEQIGSACNLMDSGKDAELPYALHEIVTFKGNTLFRSFNSDKELSKVADTFFKNEEKVRELLKDPQKSSTAPADYTEFNRVYDSIPYDLSGFSPENRIVLNAVTQEAIMLDRNLTADCQDYIDCHTLAMEKVLETDRNGPADYSAVDAALKKIPSDLSLYTEESVKPVKEAEGRIQRGLLKKDQKTVDGYAEDLEKAIKGLEKKAVITLSSISLPASYIPVKNGFKILYTGKTIKPDPVIKAGGRTLKEGQDYTISYSSSSSKNPGAYYFTVTGKDQCRGTVKAEYVIVPPAPSSVKAVLSTEAGGFDDARVSWSKVSGASGYSVRYRNSGGSWSDSIRTTGTSLTRKNLTDGVTYEFRIMPYYKHDGIRYMSTKTKSAKVTTLKKIKTPSVKKYSSSKVRVSWTNIPGESGYQISRSSKKTGTYIVSRYSTTSGTNRIVNGTKGKTYYYKVRAYKNVGDNKVYGPWSEVRTYKNK